MSELAIAGICFISTMHTGGIAKNQIGIYISGSGT